MPLVVVDIQQTARDRWIAEFEASGVVARRKLLNAGSFDEIILKVIEAHALLVPPEKPLAPSGPDRPIDESLLPPKPSPPLSRRAAQQARVALDEQTKQEWARRAVAYRNEHTQLAPWQMTDGALKATVPSGSVFKEATVGGVLYEPPESEMTTVTYGVVPPQPKGRAWTPERKRAAHEKRMARAAARQARAVAGGT